MTNRAMRWTGLVSIGLALAGPAGATRPSEVPAVGVAGASMMIASTSPGALLEPSEWACDRIRPEYEAFLEQGNKPEDWRYVGKTYRADSTGETYSWTDWLDWYESADCAVKPAATGGNNTMLYVGGGVLVLALLLAAMGGGSGSSDSPRPDSPG